MKEKTDLRIIKTYTALFNSFIELSEKKAYEDITVGELCDNAMVRRATFYKHFADKDDFFAFFIRDLENEFSNQFIHEMNTANTENTFTPEQEKSYYHYMFLKGNQFINDHMKMVKNIMSSTVFTALLDILSEEFNRNIYLYFMNTHQGASKKKALLFSSFLSGGIVQLYRCRLTNPDIISVDDISESFEELMKRLISY